MQINLQVSYLPLILEKGSQNIIHSKVERRLQM